MDKQKNWPRYARALDMRLGGASYGDIAKELGVSRERARQIVNFAKRQLAFRVFKGISRPLPPPHPLSEKARAILETEQFLHDIELA